MAHVITGYTVKAMQRKIERGDWQEGKVWRRAPDGRILIDVMGYQRWVESGFRRPPGPLASRGGAEFPERTV